MRFQENDAMFQTYVQVLTEAKKKKEDKKEDSKKPAFLKSKKGKSKDKKDDKKKKKPAFMKESVSDVFRTCHKESMDISDVYRNMHVLKEEFEEKDTETDTEETEELEEGLELEAAPASMTKKEYLQAVYDLGNAIEGISKSNPTIGAIWDWLLELWASNEKSFYQSHIAAEGINPGAGEQGGLVDEDDDDLGMGDNLDDLDGGDFEAEPEGDLGGKLSFDDVKSAVIGLLGDEGEALHDAQDVAELVDLLVSQGYAKEDAQDVVIQSILSDEGDALGDGDLEDDSFQDEGPVKHGF